jgi:DNA-directed RNA polymerase specialized sigma24 family protein
MKPLTDRHKILREAYRHYLTFKDLVSTEDFRLQFLEHKGVKLSFPDLQHALRNTKLSPRKEQAFYLNVIRDMKQKDVAEEMGITTVSVGQYVDAAVRQIAKIYFAEEEPEE